MERVHDKRELAKRHLTSTGILSGLSVATLVWNIGQRSPGTAEVAIAVGLFSSTILLIGSSIFFLTAIDVYSSISGIPESVKSRWPWVTRRHEYEHLRQVLEVEAIGDHARALGSYSEIFGVGLYLATLTVIAFAYNIIIGVIAISLVVMFLTWYLRIWFRYGMSQPDVVSQITRFLERGKDRHYEHLFEILLDPDTLKILESEYPERLRKIFEDVIMYVEDAEAIEKEFPALIPVLETFGFDSKTLKKGARGSGKDSES